MREKPQILRTEMIARTRLFQIERLDLRFPNGVEVHYECLRGPRSGAVLVVPLLGDDTILLIREYAAGVERYELSLPKGLIEGDESSLEAANREIMEEVGYGARHLEHITSLTLAPGYFSLTTHVILAQDLYEHRLPGDEPEEIEVVPWRLSRLSELLRREDFSEARSVAALFLVRDLLAGRSQSAS
jgi:ADP-ribose diphosphatase